jgi:uncharacterized membrane protein YhhN
MRTIKFALVISAAASLTFLLASQFTTSKWLVVLKVLSITLLAVVGFGVNKLLGGALIISALGDFLLGVPRLGSLEGQTLFLLGLGSFLLAHLTYILMFREYRTSIWWKPVVARIVGVLLVLIALGSMLEILWPALGDLRVLVVVYSLVLCGMGMSAMLAELGSPIAAIGALLFISSDAMIAISKFRSPFGGSEPHIWITYYTAQALILWGVVHHARQVQALSEL